MKEVYDKELKIWNLVPETSLEALEQLEGFFRADMWYAKYAEWKTEKDMMEYLKAHFNICKNQIKNQIKLKINKLRRLNKWKKRVNQKKRK